MLGVINFCQSIIYRSTFVMSVRTRQVPDIEADGKRLNTSRDPPGQKSVYILPGIKQNTFMLLNSDVCLSKNTYFSIFVTLFSHPFTI